MEPPKSLKSRRSGKLSRSRAVQSSNDSSSSEKSDDEPSTLGSRLKLLRDRRLKKPQKSVDAEGTIAQSFKRKAFGFFRRSESAKPNERDVEAAVAAEEVPGTPEAEAQTTVAVVVDVHREKSPRLEELPVEENEGEADENEDVEQQLQEEVHQRRRWERSEISADDLLEDLKKPRRRQWAQGTASAEVRNVIGRKIVLPRRSATAEPRDHPVSPIRPSKPIAAPRSKSLKKEKEQEELQGFDNDGFSSDHDEVLRIETINDCSPKIEISSANNNEIKDGASTLSDEENPVADKVSSKSSIEEIKEYVESSENSELREKSPSETIRSLDLVERRSTARRRSSSKRKFSLDKKSVDEDEDDLDEDEEEQETVLNVMDKKSRRSSSSSKIEIIPSNFFGRESSDETTISTNEEMHSSRKDTSHRSRSRSKSKASRRSRRSVDETETSSRSRTKRRTASSGDEASSSRRRTKSRPKRRKKKRGKRQELEDLEEEALKYLSVWVHRCDVLEADYITRHPMVKVHVLNAETGEYLRRRNVEEGQSETLQPIITAKFDFMEKRSMMPVWEEELIFEQDFRDVLGEGKAAVLILFEVVDLLTFSEASVAYDQFGRDNCWYKIAWAFLRPVGVGGIRHINKKVRLQLYKPKRTFRKSNKTQCQVYRWWKSGSRDKYPSSLYVTITAVEPPKLEPIFYEQLLQLQDLSDVRSDSQNLLSGKTDGEQMIELPKWTRHAAQSCQIPNEKYLETEAVENGCFCLAFSNGGKYLACVLSEEYDYSILVYKIHEGRIHARFSGHKNFVYSLSWSQDDYYLLSVSSDQTARFWDVRERIIEPIQSLPHPSYVYCGKYSPGNSSIVVTGCYDHVARVWARARPGQEFELVQELEAHESFVTSICFQPKDESCLTADGAGVIVVWAARKSRKSLIRREWQIARKINIKELDGVPINTILVHPLGARLLVHSRNGGLRLIDIVSGTVVRKFEGLKNQRIQITACISPCGGLLFCGGEDSTLKVWSLDSAKLLAVYEIESREKTVTCVDYHPYDHVLAFATYGAPIPVQILKFNREADGRKVGLKFLAMTSSMMSTGSMKVNEQLPRNGLKNLDKLSVRSLNSSTHLSQVGSVSQLLNEYKDEDVVRKHLKGKLQRFIESGPNLKAKSMNRLNGIIEKIDRILMYATTQKSPAMDLESARNSSQVFAVEERQSEVFELQELTVEYERKRKPRKHRHRSRSARNACSPTSKDVDLSKAFSDSVAFGRKISKFSDDSSNSNRSFVRDKFVVEPLQLERIECRDTESGFKDSLDTILDGKDFTSEEILDVESLRSDDTYVIVKEKGSRRGSGEKDDSSDRSTGTFVIENEIPIPKPRKRIGRIEVM